MLIQIILFVPHAIFFNYYLIKSKYSSKIIGFSKIVVISKTTISVIQIQFSRLRKVLLFLNDFGQLNRTYMTQWIHTIGLSNDLGSMAYRSEKSYSGLVYFYKIDYLNNMSTNVKDEDNSQMSSRPSLS